MFGPPLDELGEHHDGVLEYFLTDLAGIALGNVDEGAVTISDARLVLLGDSQEIADGPHRQHRPEIRHEIESIGTN